MKKRKSPQRINKNTLTTSKLDDIFSLYIRLRDADDNGKCICSTCGRVKHWSEIDNGHYIKRQWYGTRYNEYNCSVQCKACNKWEQGAEFKHRAYLAKRFGEEKILQIESIKKTRKKPRDYEMTAMIDIFLTDVRKILMEKTGLVTDALIKRIDKFEIYRSMI